VSAIRCDLCVIGAGSGGLSVAAGAAQLGRKTVLIERGEMGGDCLNTGCVPSKALIAAARAAHVARHAEVFGIESAEPKIDGRAVHDRIQAIIAAIAPNDSQARFESLGVTVIRASAHFLDPRTVRAGDATVRARRFVIATGSRPAVPPIPGLNEVPFFTNETVFEKNFIPNHLAVVGGGPVGLELAQAHRRLGAAVTVIEAARILSREDEEAASAVAETMRREGVDFRERSQITAVRESESGVTLQIVSPQGSDVLEASHLLIATGRVANVEDLGLERAGVAFDKNGIVVDRKLKTTNRRVYAIGDVAGRGQFTHLAGHHAGLVVRNALFRLPVDANKSVVPRATFTDPELAQAGLTEAEARAAGKNISIARFDFAHLDRAIVDGETEGFAKIVVGKGGRVLGATLVGAHAGELILPWVLAIERGLKLSAVAGAVAPYPTMGEISKRAASAYYAPRLFAAAPRLLVRVLSWFG